MNKPGCIMLLLSALSLAMLARRITVPADTFSFRKTEEPELPYSRPPLPGTEAPGYNPRTALLFPRPTETVKQKIPSGPAAVRPPWLSLIGYVEAGDGIMFSFRNMDTGEILFLRRGVKTGDYLLTDISAPGPAVMYKGVLCRMGER